MKCKLNENRRFICGVTSFGLSVGAEVEVIREDKSTHKVLVDFGGGLIDWFHVSVLDSFTTLQPDQ